jgi:hypothetical protein
VKTRSAPDFSATIDLYSIVAGARVRLMPCAGAFAQVGRRARDSVRASPAAEGAVARDLAGDLGLLF